LRPERVSPPPFLNLESTLQSGSKKRHPDVGGFAGSTLGGSAGIVGQSAGAVGGVNSVGRLTAGSPGVLGMPGSDITSAGVGSAEVSLVTSGIHTVRLDTQLLVTQSSAAGSASGSASGLAATAGASESVTGAANATAGSASDSGPAPSPPGCGRHGPALTAA
jgi:hypothetical protein